MVSGIHWGRGLGRCPPPTRGDHCNSARQGDMVCAFFYAQALLSRPVSQVLKGLTWLLIIQIFKSLLCARLQANASLYIVSQHLPSALWQQYYPHVTDKDNRCSARLSTYSRLFSQDVHIRDFPGGPVVRTRCFHCRGPGLDPWSVRELRFHKLRHTAKKNK